jgi:hypothetical protein
MWMLSDVYELMRSGERVAGGWRTVARGPRSRPSVGSVFGLPLLLLLLPLFLFKQPYTTHTMGDDLEDDYIQTAEEHLSDVDDEFDGDDSRPQYDAELDGDADLSPPRPIAGGKRKAGDDLEDDVEGESEDGEGAQAGAKSGPASGSSNLTAEEKKKELKKRNKDKLKEKKVSFFIFFPASYRSY